MLIVMKKFLLIPLLSLVSCSGVMSGITGEKIPTVPVQRLAKDLNPDPSGKPFNVASADVARAELNPGSTWALYNAGAVAAAVSDTKKSSVDSSSGK